LCNSCIRTTFYILSFVISPNIVYFNLFSSKSQSKNSNIPILTKKKTLIHVVKFSAVWSLARALLILFVDANICVSTDVCVSSGAVLKPLKTWSTQCSLLSIEDSFPLDSFSRIWWWFCDDAWKSQESSALITCFTDYFYWNIVSANF